MLFESLFKKLFKKSHVSDLSPNNRGLSLKTMRTKCRLSTDRSELIYGTYPYVSAFTFKLYADFIYDNTRNTINLSKLTNNSIIF